MSPDDLIKAKNFLEEAIELDPNYVMAYARLTAAYNSSIRVGLIKNPKKALAMASEVAQKAFLINDSHPYTYLALAEVYNIALVVTNQVMAKPDLLFGDPTAPIGGHIVAHACTTRIYLRKSKGDRRIARIVDSPLLAEGEAVFAIRQTGIEDP